MGRGEGWGGGGGRTARQCGPASLGRPWPARFLGPGSRPGPRRGEPGLTPMRGKGEHGVSEVGGVRGLKGGGKGGGLAVGSCGEGGRGGPSPGVSGRREGLPFLLRRMHICMYACMYVCMYIQGLEGSPPSRTQNPLLRPRTGRAGGAPSRPFHSRGTPHLPA